MECLSYGDARQRRARALPFLRRYEILSVLQEGTLTHRGNGRATVFASRAGVRKVFVNGLRRLCAAIWSRPNRLKPRAFDQLAQSDRAFLQSSVSAIKASAAFNLSSCSRFPQIHKIHKIRLRYLMIVVIIRTSVLQEASAQRTFNETHCFV